MEDHFAKLSTELVIKIFSHLEQSFLVTKVSLVCKQFRDICMDSTLWTELPGMLQAYDNPKALLGKCKQLKYLQLNYEAKIEFLAAKAIKICPGIKELSISSNLKRNKTNRFSIAKLEHIAHLLETIAEHGSELRYLELEGEWQCISEPWEDESDEEDKLSDRASRGFLHITDLVLSSVVSYSHSVWKAMGQNCRNLERFSISKCDFKQANKYVFFQGVSGTLKQLNLGGISAAEGIEHIAMCQQLQHLTLTDAKLGNTGMNAVSKLSQLKHVSVNNFSCCTIATSAEFIEAFTDHKLQNLTHLNLNDFELNLDDEAVFALADNCPKLKFLGISYCSKVTDVGVSCILQKCMELEQLGVYHVTAAAFESLGSSAINDLKLLCLAIDHPAADTKGIEESKIAHLLPRLEISTGTLTKSTM